MRRSRKWFLRRGAHRVASRNAKRSRQTRGEIWTLWVRVHLDLLGGEKRTLSLKGLVLRTDWAVRGVGGSALTWSASTRATRAAAAAHAARAPRPFRLCCECVYVEERDSIIYFMRAAPAAARGRAPIFRRVSRYYFRSGFAVPGAGPRPAGGGGARRGAGRGGIPASAAQALAPAASTYLGPYIPCAGHRSGARDASYTNPTCPVCSTPPSVSGPRRLSFTSRSEASHATHATPSIVPMRARTPHRAYTAVAKSHACDLGISSPAL